MNKILSIIIPTYNAEQFLDKGLPTFLLEDAEQLDKLEVLIVNDGTPDNSVAVAQKYVDNYPNVFRILNKENGGHGSAINAGVEAITGQYFQVVDADDWVDTKVLANVLTILERETFDAMIHGHRTYDISTDEVVEKQVTCSIEKNTYSLVELMQFWNDVYWGMTFHGVLYNTEFYRNLNYRLIEGVFYEDQEYATVPLAYAKTVRVFNEPLYSYRIGDVNQSVSTQSLIKRLPDLEKVIYRLADAKDRASEFAPGGQNYWIKKVTKCIADFYYTALIVNPNRKAGKAIAENLNEVLRTGNPNLYVKMKKKYNVFKLLHSLHMTDRGYQRYVGGLLNLKNRLHKNA